MDNFASKFKIVSLPTRLGLTVIVAILVFGCRSSEESDVIEPKISLVNSPTDILTFGANYLAKQLDSSTNGKIRPRVFHSGVLSGGKGKAEIEMCQQGSIEIHITSTAYLANLVPKMSVFSLPFLFRDLDQIVSLAKSKSDVLETVNQELRTKNLNVISWWPRGFRQLTNSSRPVRNLEDGKGLKLRVMNNALYVDIISALGAYPVPMTWGEVYNGLQLRTIDGQENAEDVIFSNRLYEAQEFMTVWDYSTDLEVVLVNLSWWNGLEENQRNAIQKVVDSSVQYQAELLRNNTEDLRKRIEEKGMEIHYLGDAEKEEFKIAVKPVWEKYETIIGKSFLSSFLAEVNQH